VDPRIQRTIDRMEQQLHRRLTVTELAGAAGVSAAHLTRLFRQGTGTTPAAFLRALRMARARLLLERTNLSVAEVMAQVGIADRSHFGRDFQRAHGVAPSAVREPLKVTSR
jgi:transcriptional regulator GlxA family with amidase domain